MHDELLLHQAFLERLARRLVVDEAAAQDLVQDTWLRALRRPPRERGALRGWLGTVARHLAIERERGGRRRLARERAAARPEETDGGLGEVDRRLDFQALLIERLRALPEAQRHALALRYVDGLSPTAIAQRLGVSVHTVKARLQRALATLREELDRASGGERATWALALLPELARGAGAVGVGVGAAGAGVGAGVGAVGPGALGAGAGAAGAGLSAGGGAGAAALAGGGILMAAGAKAAAVLLAVAALAGGWWLVRGVDAEVPDAPAGPVAAGAESENERDAEPRTAVEAREALPVAPETAREALASTGPGPGAAAAAAESGWMLRVELAGDFKGEPARITVRGRWERRRWPRDLEVVAELERPGSVLLDVGELIAPDAGDEGRLPALALVVRATHPGCVTASDEVLLDPRLDPDRPPAEPLVARLALWRGAVLVGRVEPPGEGYASAQVVAVEREDEGWSRTPIASGRVDTDGRFRLVVPRGGPHVVGAAALGLRPASQVVEARVGAELDLGVLRREPGATIEGVALHGDAPAAEHRIQAWSEARWPTLLFFIGHYSGDNLALAGDRLEWGRWGGAADGEGRFHFSGLAPGEAFLLTVSSPIGVTPAPVAGSWNPLRVVAPAQGVVLELDRGTLELVLDIPPETEVAGMVTFHTEGAEPRSQTLRSERTQAIALPPRLAVVLELELAGFLPERVDVVTPPSGETLVVRVSPTPGPEPASLALVLEGALPPEGTVFIVHDLADPFFVLDRWPGPRPQLFADGRARRIPLREGRLLVEGLPPGRRHLLLYAGEYNDRRTTFLLDVELELSLSPGERAERRVELVQGGRLRLDVTDADGRQAAAGVVLEDAAGPIAVSFYGSSPQGTFSSFDRLSPQSTNDAVPNLRPGRYRLRLELDGHAPEELDLEIRPGERTDVQLRMRRQ